jgi:enoyl-CoA hydratase/carnithine racemase
MSELVLIDIKDYVAHVRLNRPDKYNALSPEMFEAVTKAGQSLAEDKSIRAVVLSGEGRGFCAGLDFQRFAEMQAQEKPKSKDVSANLFGGASETIANRAQLVAYIWKLVPVPVIAALHGVSYGGGLQIALGADIRLASPDARFSIMEVKWGLVPDMSGTQTLRDLLRLDIAKELAFTGRIIDAKEAAHVGLITRVCDDPLKEAQELAKEIAGKSPHSVAACKHLFETAWHSSAADGLKLEEKLQRTLIGSPNNIEAVMANFEKRAPKYKDRE